MKKFLAALFLTLALARPGQCWNPKYDADVQGPGMFFYEAYAEDPWRVAGSPSILFAKSEELMLEIGIAAAALAWRKKRA